MSPLYEAKYTVCFEHIDIGNMVFYAHYLFWMHQTYEAWLEKNQSTIESFIDKEILLPIVYTECSYKHTLSLRDHFKIKMFAQDINKDSFTLEYHFFHKEKNIASAKTTHVCINKQKQRTPLPDILRSILT